jgi:Protein of unknown function (DUF3151)
MTQLPINEPLETRIEEPEGSLEALTTAASVGDVRAVAANYPECLTAWAELGERSMAEGDAVQAYAYFRTGYHRGLDRIRGAGWRGAGTVPWGHIPNQGFLRALGGLGAAAGAIGEDHEATRCSDFLVQLAPDRPR